MLDSSVFQSPDEYPELTKYAKLCEDFGKTTALNPFQLQEELEALRVAWLGAAWCATNAKDPDEVFHLVRGDDGRIESTVMLSKETWITMLAMEAMDEENGQELHD